MTVYDEIANRNIQLDYANELIQQLIKNKQLGYIDSEDFFKEVDALMRPQKIDTVTGEKTVGRPSLYTPELANNICYRVSNGESLRSICKDSTMPAQSTIHLWKLAYPEFSEQYRQAYKLKIELEVDLLIDLVDNCALDEVPKVKEQVSIRKWSAKITEPEKYGDNPVPVVATGNGYDYSKLNNEELDNYLALLEKMKRD